MEIAGGLARALPVAVEQVGKRPPADPFSAGSAFSTSAELAVFYTIAKSEKGEFEHHISLSYRGGRFASAAGGFLAAAIGRLLRAAPTRGVLALSTRGVFHYIVSLSASEHDDLVRRGVEKIDNESARRLLGQAMDDRAELLSRLGRIDVGEVKQ